jgi:hypothetical protein
MGFRVWGMGEDNTLQSFFIPNSFLFILFLNYRKVKSSYLTKLPLFPLYPIPQTLLPPNHFNHFSTRIAFFTMNVF